MNHGSYSTLLILFFATLILSFLCSLMEASILSTSHAFAETLIRKGHRSGTLLKHFKQNINRPIAAILTLNTIANTAGASLVGAQAAKLWGSHYLAVVSAALTLSILVFSEIVPKTLGAVYWKQLAPFAAYIIYALIFITRPLVFCFEQLSHLISPKERISPYSREDVRATAELGHKEGVLHVQENRIIQNILQLHNIRAKDVLTPRSVLLAFDQKKTIAQILKSHSSLRFSRIPVYGKNLDDITGFVHRYKILQDYSEGKSSQTLQAIAKPIHAIPETKSVADTLDEFIQRREHIFLVVDEYGGTAGVITMEDAIETLLGVEIMDEFDTVADMRKLAQRLGQQRKIQRRPNPPAPPKT